MHNSDSVKPKHQNNLKKNNCHLLQKTLLDKWGAVQASEYPLDNFKFCGNILLMNIGIEEKKLSDMTGKELKELIKDTLLEIIDPDHGLELWPSVEKSLKESIDEKKEGKGITLEEAKGELGIA